MKFDSESIAEWMVFTRGMVKTIKGAFKTREKEVENQPAEEQGCEHEPVFIGGEKRCARCGESLKWGFTGKEALSAMEEARSALECHHDEEGVIHVRATADSSKEEEPFTIKDSGKRREFETGAVRDIQTGKGRYDLIPWEAVHELALHCEEGAIKYGERNCEKGIPTHSLVDSAMRHLSCYLRGMKDEPHLRAAMWNVAMLIWTEKRKPEMQDIPCRVEDDPSVVIIEYGATGERIEISDISYGNKNPKKKFYDETDNFNERELEIIDRFLIGLHRNHSRKEG